MTHESGSRVGSRFAYAISNQRDENSGVLSAVGKNVHAVDIPGTGRTQERRQRSHFIGMSPASCGNQLQLIFRSFRLVVNELLVHGCQIAAGGNGQDAAVLFRKSGYVFLGKVDYELV